MGSVTQFPGSATPEQRLEPELFRLAEEALRMVGIRVMANWHNPPSKELADLVVDTIIAAIAQAIELLQMRAPLSLEPCDDHIRSEAIERLRITAGGLVTLYLRPENQQIA